jgi:hypothetical protein
MQLKNIKPGRVLGGLVLFLILIQIIPYGRKHTNPSFGSEPPWNSARTRELFFQACKDCHSHATVWPWYSHVAPASWLIQSDVDEGRSYLNVSDWPGKQDAAARAAEVVREREMPPWFYTPLHPKARLSSQNRLELVNGLVLTFAPDSRKTP